MTETLTMSQPVETAAPHRDAPRGVRRLVLDTTYAVSALPVAVVAFVLTVTGLSLGLATLVVLPVGVVVLGVTAQVARGLAGLERLRLRSLLGRRAPSPARPPVSSVWWRRAVEPYRDPQTWLDVVWGLVSLVTGTIAFSIVVAWWGGILGGLTYWFWSRWLPESNEGLAELLGLGEGRDAESLLHLAIGAVLLLTLVPVVRAVTATHAGLATTLLCSRAELQQEVQRVETGRDAARQAEASSLRRLERDIHDGPQQRLVRLSMDLGRARKQLGTDPEQAGATIDAALVQARETVEELRALSRGIAPPLLVDRGLAVALEEMVLRSPVPVETRLDLPADLPPHVETAVYFVVAEALTNVAKHAGAARAVVTARPDGDELLVLVEDDGLGGAHEGKGLGLAGLRQRLTGVDGTLLLDSPVGGPTALVARIPLGPGRGAS
ncbi:sensor histidine kinase [Nocardioides sp. SYSU D00038]|uniref:sensor histidine kinase n=1 Tax=Nocardioides sp. SYSU D00038 TaxID=2812554 RepID=UPI001968971C|nr:sensor histidine kinase [Nocardioides sp. SYSU D00038]